MRAYVALAAVATLLGPTLLARRAEAAEVRAESEVRRVAVGQPFTVQVTAILDDGDGNAQTPKLPVQGAAEVAGPSIFSQRRVVMRNFDIKTENNVVATYEITPTAPGRLVIGPGSFVVDGKRIDADALTIEVVEGPPPGSRPSRTLRDPSPFGQGPFGQDPFGQGPFGRQDPPSQDPFDMLRRRGGLSGYPDAPAELTLDSAPNQVGFLIAQLDQPTAVLGEPVVLSIYAYGGRGAFREVSPMEPALADFLSYPSVETSHEQPFFRTEIQGQDFLVVKLREFVLVPLRAGDLEIGSMRAILRGRTYPSQGSPLGTLAVSPPLKLAVREPPMTDRPPGYRLGDVGRFELSAEVSPREIDQNAFFSVQLDLRGMGNLPASVEMPEVPGIVWGDPTVRGEVHVEDRALAGGRKLEFTVRATKPGTIELGTVALPHFDPATNRYHVASAALGSIEVAAAAGSDAAKPVPSASPAEPEDSALLQSLAPRTTKAGFSEIRRAPPLWALGAATIAPGLIWLLTLLPLAFAGAGRRLSQRRSKKLHLDFPRLLAVEKNAGRAQVARELEQLVYGLLEEKTGLRARAILKDHLAREIEHAGLDGELARELQELLLALDSARFLATSESDQADSLVERARPALQKLWKAQAGGKAG